MRVTHEAHRMTLRSTIQQIKLRDGDKDAIGNDASAFVQCWRNDLSALYDQVRALLSGLENEQLLEFGYVTFNLDEEELGRYAAPGLTLTMANRTIYLAPQARLTTDGAGRVDLYKKDNPASDARIYIVRRFREDGSLLWLVEKKERKKPAPYGLLHWQALEPPPERRYEPLSTRILEDALDLLLTG